MQKLNAGIQVLFWDADMKNPIVATVHMVWSESCVDLLPSGAASVQHSIQQRIDGPTSISPSWSYVNSSFGNKASK